MITLKTNFNQFLGTMVQDPFDGIDPDRKIYVEMGMFTPNDPPGVYAVHDMAHYDGMVLSVHFFTEKWSSVEGTAVMVAPGIAIAAAHVIEEHIPSIMSGEVHIICAGFTPTGPRYWRVRHMTKADGTDVMVLSLEYASPIPDDGRFVQATMTLRLPKIGELVMIAGFRASTEHVAADPDMHFPMLDGVMKYGADVLIGIGEVTQHYLSGRGVMLPGPGIEVACSTPGGLSGGPAFDATGNLIGTLTSSLDHADGRGPSLVSLLWPALVQPITPAFLPQLLPESFKLLDLDPKLCGIDGRDAIHRAGGPDNGTIWIEIEV